MSQGSTRATRPRAGRCDSGRSTCLPWRSVIVRATSSSECVACGVAGGALAGSPSECRPPRDAYSSRAPFSLSSRPSPSSRSRNRRRTACTGARKDARMNGRRANPGAIGSTKQSRKAARRAHLLASLAAADLAAPGSRRLGSRSRKRAHHTPLTGCTISSPAVAHLAGLRVWTGRRDSPEQRP